MSVTAATVQVEDYRVDYTVSSLSDVTVPISNAALLKSLIVSAAPVAELSQALVVPLVELKLQYLLQRLPKFPASMVCYMTYQP